jgi:hypothetical protein
MIQFFTIKQGGWIKQPAQPLLLKQHNFHNLNPWYKPSLFDRPFQFVISVRCFVAIAWFYPLTRERHARVRAMLERKKERNKEKK